MTLTRNRSTLFRLCQTELSYIVITVSMFTTYHMIGAFTSKSWGFLKCLQDVSLLTLTHEHDEEGGSYLWCDSQFNPKGLKYQT